MKIIAVGMNYREHIAEMDSAVPKEPVIFCKPDSSLMEATEKRPLSNMPFFLPDFSSDLQYEAEVVVRINRLGKNIATKYAHRYYDEVTIGLDLTARDLQKSFKTRGYPWELCKGFDQSAVVGSFLPISEMGDINQLPFHLTCNGKTVQTGNTAYMLFSVDTVIEYVSRFFTLKTGDLIFTGTPPGVGPLAINDHLEGFLSNRKLLDLRVK